jgi:hypothetical protein
MLVDKCIKEVRPEDLGGSGKLTSSSSSFKKKDLRVRAGIITSKVGLCDHGN